MKKIIRILLVLIAIYTLTLQHATANTSETKCRLEYSLKSWSLFYKKGDGAGEIICDNGQSVNVTIQTRGGGLSFGKNEIIDGDGNFTPVHDISEVLGSYAASEAHAGASKSVGAQAMTNGDVSLSLSGKGKGFDLGFAFGKFRISKSGSINVTSSESSDPVITTTHVIEAKPVKKSSSGVVEKEIIKTTVKPIPQKKAPISQDPSTKGIHD